MESISEIHTDVQADERAEAPENAEVTLDTSKLGVEECVDEIIDKLLALGYILPHGHISA